MNRTIGYVQFEARFGDWETNAQTAAALIEEDAEADLLVLPELALSGYDFPDPDAAREMAEPSNSGATADWARDLAQRHDVALVIGYPELADDRVYNASMLVQPDGTVHNYRKIHLFSRELTLFQPGDAPPPVIETPAGRVGLMICFDWIFPETARLLALNGAQIIAHASNLVLPWCQQAMFTRCLENRVFAITANRIGTETQAGRELTFTGASQVMSPTGERLVSAPTDAPHVGLATIDPAEADDKQLNEFNNLLGDRRTDLYGDLF